MHLKISGSNAASTVLGHQFRIFFVVACALVGAVIGSFSAPNLAKDLYHVATGIVVARPVATSVVGPEGTALPDGPAPNKTLTPRDVRTEQSVVRAQRQTPGIDDAYAGATSAQTRMPFALLGAMLGAILGFQLLKWLDTGVRRWEHLDSPDRLVVVGGIVLGMVFSASIFSFLRDVGLGGPSLPFLYVGVMIATITISVYLLRQVTEMIPLNRGRGPMRRTGIKLLDTNVIIDARIYDVAKAGFLEGQMYLPQFVLEELQHIADHPDALRRQRGKRGLEVLTLMQADFEIDAGSKDHFAGDPSEPVDSRLVKLARAIGADLVTNDHNLNRVASLQNVKVLNINDLALALRPNVLPAESLVVTIIKEGNQIGQGVGYLDDGTMVVVENGRTHLTETCEIRVTQVIQTERGKMIFGEIAEEEPGYQEPIRRIGSVGPQRRRL